MAHNDDTRPTPTPYAARVRNQKVIQPLHDLPKASIQTRTSPDNNPAADLIRSKLDALYAEEPPARDELAEAQAPGAHSKHQLFMRELNESGKSLAEIQTEWHAYYTALPDVEKHEVWQEFYTTHAKAKAVAHHQAPTAPERTTQETEKPTGQTVPAKSTHTKKRRPDTPDAALKSQLLATIEARTRVRKNPHVQSLLFGLSAGLVVIAIMLFSFFNERFIAPFITPSRTVSSAAIITDPNNTQAGNEPLIIIPKINVEIPVVYDVKTIKEADVQEGLERGVVHYATTPMPGEKGNGVIFGHSANNILNKGKYKFAFVLLKQLEPGDLFYIQKDGTRYAYKVYDKTIVAPSEVGVLNRNDKPATFTLITCDPPGTNLKRLVVVGEQISPDPSNNKASSATPQANNAPITLPSNSPSLWQRVQDWLSI